MIQEKIAAKTGSAAKRIAVLAGLTLGWSRSCISVVRKDASTPVSASAPTISGVRTSRGLPTTAAPPSASTAVTASWDARIAWM